MRDQRRWLMVALMVLVSAAPLSAQGRGRGTPNPDRGAVNAVVTTIASTIQAEDWAGLDSLFAGGGMHIVYGAQVAHGLAGYVDGALKPQFEGLTIVEYSFGGVEAVVRESVAWVTFSYTLAAQGPGGAAVADNGRGTAVLEKRDGRWLVVHYHVGGD